MPLSPFSIYYSDAAVDDLALIVSYYESINPILKDALRTALLAAENDLMRNPNAFAKINYRDFRRILLKHFPYKMVYRVASKKVYIFAILHQARSNRSVRKRLKN